METLICGNYETSVQDFFMEKRICNIDLKFESRNEFEKFLSAFEEYSCGKGVFPIRIGEHSFNGWFGNMLYDKNYNVRVYIGVYDEDEGQMMETSGKTYGIGRSVIGLANAMRELCDSLNKSNVLSEEEKDKILTIMNTPETMIELRYLVDDLPQYLKENQSTLGELKRRESGARI